MIVQPPSARHLSPDQLAVASRIAGRLVEAGYRAWLVGGAVRDLARGVGPKDLDMVTSAHPEQVEGLFPRTLAIGRAFGILIVSEGGMEVEVATLRSEGRYDDGRHPAEVRYGTTVEEDAARRDFTCNALYLDPLTDQWVDPTGGLDDLRAGILRSVGNPERRFSEDGLRLLRMARFLALLGAAPADGLLGAAAGSLEALRGVSRERVLDELSRSLSGPRVEVAVEGLLGPGILQAALPEWAERDCVPVGVRLSALQGLGRPLGTALGLAWLLQTELSGSQASMEGDLTLLDGLRPSKRLRRAVERIWTVSCGVSKASGMSGLARLLRDPGWEAGCELAIAWAVASGSETDQLRAKQGWRATATQEELFPKLLLSAEELMGAGLAEGPRLGEALGALEDAQLEGRVSTREEALAWLAGREDPS